MSSWLEDKQVFFKLSVWAVLISLQTILKWQKHIQGGGPLSILLDLDGERRKTQLFQ